VTTTHRDTAECQAIEVPRPKSTTAEFDWVAEQWNGVGHWFAERVP